MAARVQALAAHVVEEYDGRAERLWEEAATGTDLLRRLQALPGFGKQKSQIFVALVGKQLGVRPEGWEAGRRRLRRGRVLPLGGGRGTSLLAGARCVPSRRRRRPQPRA